MVGSIYQVDREEHPRERKERQRVKLGSGGGASEGVRGGHADREDRRPTPAEHANVGGTRCLIPPVFPGRDRATRVVGSGLGERVLIAQGSVAAAWFAGKPPPVDALIIGSIDQAPHAPQVPRSGQAPAGPDSIGMEND